MELEEYCIRRVRNIVEASGVKDTITKTIESTNLSS